MTEPLRGSELPGFGESGTVSIVPGVSILAVLSNLNYKTWFALAEYVDNAVQSSVESRESLLANDGRQYMLRVDVDIDPASEGTICIRDNAAGIARADFARAFRPADVPPDRSGLSEFGMGMKSASCWFARRWTVRTTSIGDPLLYTVTFDVEAIVRNQTEELVVTTAPTELNAHFTEVVLEDLHHLPVGRSVGKIKQHLNDIYRVLTREHRLDLRVNGETMSYVEPAVLKAPFYRDSESESLEWRKDIAFDFGQGLEVHGFAALREIGSTSNAGFALFRRGRVIEGSGDEGYRPAGIFGAGNSYRSQRLFGELHLEGFDVSHTKDGFQWDDNEDSFLALLKEELDQDPLPLLKQAEGFRKHESTRSQLRAAEQAVANTASALKANLPIAISEVKQLDDSVAQPIVPLEKRGPNRTVAFELSGQAWNIAVEIVPELGNREWFVGNIGTDDPAVVDVKLRINSAHPFLVRFGQRDTESLEVILRMAVAIVVGETIARQADVKKAGVVTRNINEVLSRALSGP